MGHPSKQDHINEMKDMEGWLWGGDGLASKNVSYTDPEHHPGDYLSENIMRDIQVRAEEIATLAVHNKTGREDSKEGSLHSAHVGAYAHHLFTAIDTAARQILAHANEPYTNEKAMSNLKLKDADDHHKTVIFGGELDDTTTQKIFRFVEQLYSGRVKDSVYARYKNDQMIWPMISKTGETNLTEDQSQAGDWTEAFCAVLKDMKMREIFEELQVADCPGYMWTCSVIGAAQESEGINLTREGEAVETF